MRITVEDGRAYIAAHVGFFHLAEGEHHGHDAHQGHEAHHAHR